MSSDGQRFILSKDTDPAPDRVRVVKNWFKEFEER
jgi:hypothetical protein